MTNPLHLQNRKTFHDQFCKHRLACRSSAFTIPTAGQAPIHLQANLLVLPKKYADDFRLLCHRNPVPCPLLAESASPGDFRQLKSYVQSADGRRILAVADNIDLRHDFPRYRVYHNSEHVPVDGVREPTDVAAQWSAGDHVGFLVGCSFSFERALHEAGLTPQHMTHRRNVPMFRTNIPLCPAGVFTGGTYVVSMRPYRMSDVEEVRDITRPFGATHGEPVAWGWDGAERIGIEDVARPDWGDQAVKADGVTVFAHGDEELVPVFWGCGVTPQEAVMKAGLEGTSRHFRPITAAVVVLCVVLCVVVLCVVVLCVVVLCVVVLCVVFVPVALVLPKGLPSANFQASANDPPLHRPNGVELVQQFWAQLGSKSFFARPKKPYAEPT
ncbi:putative hydro-lyase [Colletotrichum orbiculare MAFF 240422]|uniref:Hydro-lyase n=1 Tax=Colletotrichum orbiculare (strain 104-T / ATCC 96160 / CBS 514.97 / LARS 414 / MAFF 240422) TaxID=1213857 RepID=A0A484FCR6_COLOR|nr:putative hydro-lyase [Colletotrichum orbiculare MAFF 240422]